ncbi:MAG: hypothetical protein Q4A34_03250 [Candidatus Saccharibacteria bacterium]|nr:hypothetical protein [Candidatus Saccharibacteria bacterium]
MPEKTPHPHFIDGAPPVAGEIKVLSLEEQARAEYTEAIGKLHKIADTVGAKSPGGAEVDITVADYIQEGLSHCGDDTACTEGALRVGVAEIAQPESQPRTAEVIAKLLNEGHPGVEGALKTAEMAGVDMKEVVQEIDNNESKNELSNEGDILQEMHEIIEHFHKGIIEDGVQNSRPSYIINGRKITFCAFEELLPESDRVKYCQLEELDIHDNESIAIIGAKPDTLVNAALQMAASPETRRDLIELSRDIQTAPPFTEKLKTMLSEVGACIGLQEDKNNGDALAIVLAGLAGDERARKVMRDSARYIEENSNMAHRSIEGISPENMEKLGSFVFVRSTSHPIDRDEAGNVIFYSAANYLNGKHARSTIHFTVNGQVASHVFGTWSNENRLVVTNARKMIERNNLPVYVNAADTYFAKDLGEALVCPDAVVIEGVPDQAELFIRNKDAVTYSVKEQYSIEEEEKIRNEAYLLGVNIEDGITDSVVREVTLRKVAREMGAEHMQQIGAHYGLGGGHRSFGELIKDIDPEIGHGLHTYTADAGIEAYPGLKYELAAAIGNSDRRYTASVLSGTVSSVSPETLRTLAWTGRIQVRDFSKEHRDAITTQDNLSGIRW